MWKPDDQRVAQSNLSIFMDFLRCEKNLDFSDYPSLYEWSVAEIDSFWQSVWEFGDFIHSKTYDAIRVGNEIKTAHWFLSTKLNFAENLLKFQNDKSAIIYWAENGEKEEITFSELYDQVARMAQWLKKVGVDKGDRVAAFISNRPEAIIGMLATTSIGAIWSSCSPDFGFEGVLDRFGQIEPKIVIAIENYQYNGKLINRKDLIEKLAEAVPSIEQVIVVEPSQTFMNKKFNSWQEVQNTSADSLRYEQLPFDHPVYIMYSSGTTGKPKCIVHGAGGTLLQHFKELSLHTDLQEEDVLTYYTTCGWMMWNWMVSSLMMGTTIFIYDGSPVYPSADILFKAVDEVGINVLGTSPKFLSTCQSKGLSLKDQFDLSSLRTILSTGSPLSDENFDYVYQDIKKDVQLSSISGGTDILSCFMLGNPLEPVYKGELQGRGLGMKVETFDVNGKSVMDDIGELVCTAPFPSRPSYFWDDSKGEKYQKAYFDRFEGVWTHGDFIKINNRGGCIVYGRSDATLNAGGIRIGTAEIYGPVEAIEKVVESIVVGVEKDNDTEILLFIILQDGLTLNDELKNKIKSTLRSSRSPRHVPHQIYQVTDIPRTISGKKVELAVKKVLEGQTIDNKEALANPESLEQFVSITVS